MSPFAWQSNKAILFYFTPNSVSEIQFGVRIQRQNFSYTGEGLQVAHDDVKNAGCPCVWALPSLLWTSSQDGFFQNLKVAAWKMASLCLLVRVGGECKSTLPQS